jgi:hypothetical protein
VGLPGAPPDAVYGPCAGDPTQSCVVGFNEWDETRHAREEHLDVVTATVILAPAHYAWDFGDDLSGPWRHDSHLQFAGIDGIGRPYRDPLTPSPVVHKYRESSRRFYDQGGFHVQLQVRWSAAASVTVSTDGVVSQTATFGLPDRVGNYGTLVQVRESQPVLVASAP